LSSSTISTSAPASSRFAGSTSKRPASLRTARRGDVGLAQQHLVDRGSQPGLVDAGAHGGIALRVEVDQQHALVQLGQSGRQVDAGGGLADPALLVCYAKYFRHAGSSFVTQQTTYRLYVKTLYRFI
jgi:hypothetical protein